MSPTVCLEDLFRNRKCMTSSPQTTFNPTSQESPLTLDLDVYHSWASSVFSLFLLRPHHVYVEIIFSNVSVSQMHPFLRLSTNATSSTKPWLRPSAPAAHPEGIFFSRFP